MFKFIRSMFGGSQQSVVAPTTGSVQVTGDSKVLFLLRRDGQISSESFHEIYPTYYARCECLDRLRKSGHTIKKDVKPKIDSKKRLRGNTVTYYLI